MALFDIRGLTFTYPEGQKPALSNVDLSIHRGEFVVVCGKSGCGKSTLLRHLKTVLTPFGKRTGEVLYRGQPLEQCDQRTQAGKIGFVFQNPDNQIVTDKVWHELAFGLESLGCDTPTIRLRVAEMASFFGIQQWYHKTVFELSGGQKQLLNLAAIMAMQPDILVLDEPTSQLDPITAADFINTVKKINDELGTTVILSEHRLEEAFPRADRVVVVRGGQVVAHDRPEKIGFALRETNDPMLYAMPTPMRLYLALEPGGGGECPVTVREGKRYMEKYTDNATVCGGEDVPPGKQATWPKRKKRDSADNTIIQLKDVWFRYEKQGEDIVRDLSLEVNRGELYCIVGGNGTGKTTAVNIISGINKPYRGKVTVNGLNVVKSTHMQMFDVGVTMMPQDPQSLFLRKTIREDLAVMLDGQNLPPEEVERRILEVADTTEITGLMGMHPYDVSGGEQQRVALAKVLLTQPEILLLDEPTKGMDSFFKRKFAGVLNKLRAAGTTVLIVSHDIEFCAVHADRCALFFDGGIITENEPHAFFSGNSFYTTATNRMCRHMFDDAITVEDVISLCR